MVGDEDHICPPSLATEIATAIPNARLEIIPGAGHYASLDQPQAVGRALQRWLAAPVLPISEIPFKELK
jgi:pimeloyl-ACP methyl ester carboxylesterase